MRLSVVGVRARVCSSGSALSREDQDNDLSVPTQVLCSGLRSCLGRADTMVKTFLATLILLFSTALQAYTGPSQVKLQSTANPATYSQSVTLSAEVTASSGSTTGSVSFLDRGVILGTASVTNAASTTNQLKYSSNFTGVPTVVWSVWPFDNSSFSLVNSTSTAPDGTGTATKFTVSGTGQGFVLEQFVTQSSIQGKAFSVSVYLRADGACNAVLGTESSTSWEGTAVAITPTSTWQRYNLTHTYEQDGQNVSLYVVGRPGCTLYVWGAQLEESGSAGPFVQTTATPATIYSGTATFTTNTLAGGSHPITAVYNGDSNNEDSSSEVLIQEINAAATFTEIKTSINPAAYSQNVTFTAKINTSGGAPTGGLTFMDGTTPLSTVAVTPVTGSNQLHYSSMFGASTPWAVWTFVGSAYSVVSTNAVAPDATNTATKYTVTGGYDGMVIEQFVSQSNIQNKTYTMSVFLRSDGSCNAVLGTESSTSWEGTAIGITTDGIWRRYNLTYTYQNSGQNVSLYVVGRPGCTFYIWGAQLEEAGATGAYIATGALGAAGYGGVATFTTDTLGGGSHSITAVYNGDGSTTASTSGVLTQEVASGTFTEVKTSATPTSYQQNVTFTAHVNTSGGTPTGTVAFKDGSTTLNTATVTQSPGANQILGSSGFTATEWDIWALSGSNYSMINTTSAAPDGTNSATKFTVTGTGDGMVIEQFVPQNGVLGKAINVSLFLRSDGACNAVLGTESSPSWDGTAVAISTTTAWQRYNLTYTYQQQGQNASLYLVARPGCTVYLWGAQLDETSTVRPYIGTGLTADAGYGGTATFSTTALAAGTHSITAVYSGDSNVNASTSAALVQTVISPTISSLSITGGAVGSTVTITGSSFGATQGTSTVTFNGVAGSPTSWSATQIVVPVPVGATTGNIVVTIAGQSSNGVGFTVAPIVTSVSPGSGTVGTAITVTGQNFGASQGASTITFNGATATPTSWNATTIVVPVPSGSASGNIVVTVSGLAGSFAFGVQPSIGGIAPNPAITGATVTVTGSSFGATQGTSTVTFNGTNATPSSWSASSVSVPVPSGATSGNVVIVVGGLASSGVAFNIKPNISGISPGYAPGGALVTISGQGFGSAQGSSSVAFNGVATPEITSWSSTNIVARVPVNGSSGNVVVTVGSVTSDGVSFSVVPTISGISPANASAGTPVTISGQGFGATQGSSTVTFNGIVATPTSWSATSIVAPVPSGATTGNVIVAVGGQSSNGASFTSTNPGIVALLPNAGRVSTVVNVTGTNFGPTQGTSTITFNGVQAYPTSWSNGTIVVPVPFGASTGNVVVTVNGIASNSVPFTVSPEIAGVSWPQGPVGVGLNINGTNFGSSQGTSTVKIGTTVLTVVSWSSTQIRVQVPQGTPLGASSIIVTVSGQASNSWTFTVTPFFSCTL